MLSKILGLDDLIQKLQPTRAAGKRIVFTNGCFDILHMGHIRYLSAAKAEGDILIIGLNSDASVKSFKEKGRPIITQDQRAEVLASLECVDYITIFDETDPLKLLKRIMPAVLVKGADWAEAQIIGADFVKSTGGKVVRVPVVPEISTSRIIQRIKERYS